MRIESQTFTTIAQNIVLPLHLVSDFYPRMIHLNRLTPRTNLINIFTRQDEDGHPRFQIDLELTDDRLLFDGDLISLNGEPNHFCYLSELKLISRTNRLLLLKLMLYSIV